MPYTFLKRSAELALYPDGHRWHAQSPGDYICGRVTRSEKLVSPETSLLVALRGESRVSYTSGGSQTSTRHSSTFTFFTNDQYSPQQTLHVGPMHVEEGLSDGLSWEFRIQLPKTSGLSFEAHRWKYTKGSYLPIEQEEIVKHPLPPSFYAPIATTDYFLEAILEYKTHGKTERVTSRAPIHVRAESLTNVITDFNLTGRRFKLNARRYTLLPGISRDQLSFKQKTKSLFGTRDVPTLRLQVDFSLPRVVQLGHPDCLPLKLQVRKEAAGTSEDLHDLSLKATVTSIRIICKETCIARASEFDFERSSSSRDLGLESVFDALEAPLEVEVHRGASEIDLGAKLNLRLHADGLYTGNRCLIRLHQGLTPSFTTYNIKVEHEFKYRLSLEIGGHKEEFEDRLAVTLLAEPQLGSADGLSPPPDVADVDAAGPSQELPPPSFTDVVEEDQLAGRATGADVTLSTK